VETEHKHSPRVWIFMVDSRNSQDLRDLDHLDAILWGANPNAKRGDLVLMYRTAPYSDIPYVFVAGSDPRPTRKQDQADTDYVIELISKLRLLRPLSLAQMNSSTELSSWPFTRYQQGAMRRRRDIKEEGVWPALRRMLVAANPQLATMLRDLAATEDSSMDSEGQGQLDDGKQLKLFLSYASEDRSQVLRLYRRLKREQQFDPWWDKDGISAGEDWKVKIRAALESCDAVVVCMSSRSFAKVSFLQTEIGWALKIANQRPEGTTFIIPVRLGPCQIPARLSKWQWVDLFRKGGHKKLTDDLQKHFVRASALPTNREQ
jgi:hypothetical protein